MAIKAKRSGGPTIYNYYRTEGARAAEYTPTNSDEQTGSLGEMTFDTQYIYVKTSAGWKRAILSLF